MELEKLLDDIENGEYDHFVNIDKYALDVELEEIGDAYLKICKIHLKVIKLRDLAKINLEALSAETEKLIRSSPYEFGIDKSTEGAVKAVLATSSELVKLQKILVDWNYAEKFFAYLRDSMQTKRDSLHTLQKLYSDGYYSQTNTISKGIGLKRKKEKS